MIYVVWTVSKIEYSGSYEEKQGHCILLYVEQEPSSKVEYLLQEDGRAIPRGDIHVSHVSDFHLTERAKQPGERGSLCSTQALL